METAPNLLKSVVVATSQYVGHKIERNLVFLQRQIDVLISKTSRGCSLKFFNPSEVLPAECITCLVNIVSDPSTKSTLVLKCLLLFNNLADLARTLTKLLGDQPQTMVLFSLTLLLNVCSQEKVGGKFFTDTNAPRTFQMIFNMLMDADSGEVRKYAVDLMKDAMKIFELLTTLCQEKEVRIKVCKAMLATFQIQDQKTFPNLAKTPLSQIADPLLATIHWSGQSTDTYGRTPLAALDLLHEIYEALVFSHDRIHHEKHISAVLPTVLQTLSVPLDGDNATIQRRCEAMVVPFLACGLGSTNRQRVQQTMEIIVLGAKLEGFPTVILSDALVYNNSGRDSQTSHSSSCYPTHPHKRQLIEDKENQMVLRNKPVNSHHGQDFPDKSDGDDSIQTLISSLNNSLAIKDGKMPELMAVYERSLQALQTKEQHLQDLLEAKTLALTQADRMLAQYRSRKGQDEAEFNRLRSLLIQAEKRCEGLQHGSTDMQGRIDKYSKEVDDLHTENRKLQEVAKMHQQLTVVHTELTEAHESLQKSHQTLRQEHNSLTEMHEMLQKHNTNLKQQYDLAMEQLTALQDERRKISTQLKTSEAKLDAKITSYEEEIKELKTEVHKHRQIAALINSLSGGQPSDASMSNASKTSSTKGEH
ncbi:CIP2A-like protein [Mya arenaria]|uniref:CIP2A-like protein n=1 Tax=Mya arenaria TaxID=6604 RepID=A0ABY7ECE6_MYAAR|nr:CIP2A-like protein [Mya arenaria]